MSGPVRCAEADLQLALAGQTGMERLDLRIAADGRWRIDLLVRPSEPAAAARLAAAGFTASGGAYVRRIEGSF
jgi:general secretion pathway protein N